MATLSSQLILSLRDRVTGPARVVGRSIDGLDRKVDGLGARSAMLAGGLGRLGAGLALSGAGFVGVGIGATSAVRGAMDVESAMADLAKVSDLTNQELIGMRDRADDLSSTMPVASTEILGLMAAASQFGIASDDLEAFSVAATRAAVAFDMDPSMTAQSLSEIKNGYKLTMDQLTELGDAINYTADSAGTSESRLIDFLTRTGSTAQTYGISAQEMLAYGASLNEIGIESSKAATGLNSMVTKVANLADNDDAVEMLDRIGGEGFSSTLQAKFYEKPVEALNDLWRVSSQMTASQRSGFFLEFFGLEYGDDASAIVENIDKIIGRQEDLAESANYVGSVERTYATFAETTSSKLKILRNNIGNVGNAIGATLLPGVVDFSDRLSNSIATLDERVTAFDRAGAALSGFMAGLGVEGENLQSVYDNFWESVFGKSVGFEADTDRLGAIFRELEIVGEGARQFADDVAAVARGIGSVISAVERFTGMGDGGFFDLMKVPMPGDEPRGGKGLINRWLDGDGDTDTSSIDEVQGKVDDLAESALTLSSTRISVQADPSLIDETKRKTDEAKVALTDLGAMRVKLGVDSSELTTSVGLATRLRNLLSRVGAEIATSDPPAYSGVEGARASGGPVRSGLPYLVNEDTPRSEVMVPSRSGGVLNVQQAQRALRQIAPQIAGGGGRSGPVSVSFGDIVIQGGAAATADQIADALGRRVQSVLGSHYSDAGV